MNDSYLVKSNPYLMGWCQNFHGHWSSGGCGATAPSVTVESKRDAIQTAIANQERLSDKSRGHKTAGTRIWKFKQQKTPTPDHLHQLASKPPSTGRATPDIFAPGEQRKTTVRPMSSGVLGR